METMRADLHNHLRTSSRIYEGDFNRAINLARDRLGISPAFAMVNFSDNRYERLIKLKGYGRHFIGPEKRAVYVPRQGALVIKGQEVPTKSGHILALGLPAGVHLKDHQTLEDTLKAAEDHGAAIVADHPFYLGSIGKTLVQNPEILERFNAIEVHNGEAAAFCAPFPGAANRKAQRFYDEMKGHFPHLGALASSDGHSFYELGSSYTEMLKPDLTDGDKFMSTFKDSLSKCRSRTIHHKTSSILGGVDHMADLAFFIAVSKAKGLFYGADKPQRSEAPAKPSERKTVVVNETSAVSPTISMPRKPGESFNNWLARKRDGVAEYLRARKRN